jgi:hypothetical protein
MESTVNILSGHELMGRLNPHKGWKESGSCIVTALGSISAKWKKGIRRVTDNVESRGLSDRSVVRDEEVRMNLGFVFECVRVIW